MQKLLMGFLVTIAEKLFLNFYRNMTESIKRKKIEKNFLKDLKNETDPRKRAQMLSRFLNS